MHMTPCSCSYNINVTGLQVVANENKEFSFLIIVSTPVLMTVLFVMCVACLAGAALMAFKKTRTSLLGILCLPLVIRSEIIFTENNWI